MPKLPIIVPRVPDAGVKSTHPLSATQVEFMKRFLTTVDSAKEAIALKTLEGKIKQLKGLQGAVLGVDISPIVAAFEKFHTILSNNKPNVDVMKNAMRSAIDYAKRMEGVLDKRFLSPTMDEEGDTEEQNRVRSTVKNAALIYAMFMGEYNNNTIAGYMDQIYELYEQDPELVHEVALNGASVLAAYLNIVLPDNPMLAPLLKKTNLAQYSLDLYEDAIQNAYEITIAFPNAEYPYQILLPDGRSWDSVAVGYGYEELRNYQEGADILAQFFASIYEGEDELDRFDYFRRIMGEITIVRTNVRPPLSSYGRGYTPGQIMYDNYGADSREEVSDRKADASMTPTNFAHELFHSFNRSSGMGSFYHSPQGQYIGGYSDYYNTPDNLDDDVFTPGLWSILRETRNRVIENDLSIENLRGEGNIRGYNDDAVTEILADAGLNIALGNIPFDTLPEDIQNAYRLAIQNAITYHTPPEEMIQQINAYNLVTRTLVDFALNVSLGMIPFGSFTNEIFAEPIRDAYRSTIFNALTYHTSPYEVIQQLNIDETETPTPVSSSITERVYIRHDLTDDGKVDLTSTFYFAQYPRPIQIIARTPEEIEDTNGETKLWVYIAIENSDIYAPGTYQYGWVRQDFLPEELSSNLEQLDIPEITLDQTFPQR